MLEFQIFNVYLSQLISMCDYRPEVVDNFSEYLAEYGKIPATFVMSSKTKILGFKIFPKKGKEATEMQQ